MIEGVERLYSQLKSHPFRQFRFLRQNQVLESNNTHHLGAKLVRVFSSKFVRLGSVFQLAVIDHIGQLESHVEFELETTLSLYRTIA